MNAEGGFYCALDADSLNAENHLEEGALLCLENSWIEVELL